MRVKPHLAGATGSEQTNPMSETEPIPAWDTDGVVRPLDKLDVHRRGLKHLAVSVFLLDGDRTLLQQRAAGKYHSAGLWANSCCTHPHWSEHYAVTAARRLREELGVTGLTLRRRPSVEYRAEVGDGLVEHELVHIFTAEVRAGALALRPDPAEVAAVRWVTLDGLAAEIAAEPGRFAPWLRIYMAEHRALILDSDG
jgi:isopentenyl-diphosphate delta-isomerase